MTDHHGDKYLAIRRLRAIRKAMEGRDEAIINADAAGLTRRAISVELGVSPTTVYDVLRKAGRIHERD